MNPISKQKLFILIFSLFIINQGYAKTEATLECTLSFNLYSKNDGGTLQLSPIKSEVLRDEPTMKYLKFGPTTNSVSSVNPSMNGFEIILEASYLRRGVIPRDPTDWWVQNAGQILGRALLVHREENGKARVIGSADFNSNLISSPKELDQLKNGISIKKIPFSFTISNGDYQSWLLNKSLDETANPTPEEKNQLTQVTGQCQYVQIM